VGGLYWVRLLVLDSDDVDGTVELVVGRFGSGMGRRKES
jgi:hypothetical protein